ncbi:hypothetical protein [Adhaeribacter aquaticus]|uniref:hypothetical protein n=1 Tax=Adhaeribacter aquaticus TaxID=299567 RepID=UPI0003F6E171|nr:hypothetical protein [Adhaeribacter aquaticus]
MDLDFTGFIETECGKKFKIDIFDQLALGVLQSEKFLDDPSLVPTTFSLYKTITDLYLLEITRFDEEKDNLITTYKILSEAEAAPYLDNCYISI